MTVWPISIQMEILQCLDHQYIHVATLYIDNNNKNRFYAELPTAFFRKAVMIGCGWDVRDYETTMGFVVGKYGDRVRCPNVERFLQFAGELGLFATNTSTLKKCNHAQLSG